MALTFPKPRCVYETPWPVIRQHQDENIELVHAYLICTFLSHTIPAYSPLRAFSLAGAIPRPCMRVWLAAYAVSSPHVRHKILLVVFFLSFSGPPFWPRPRLTRALYTRVIRRPCQGPPHLQFPPQPHCPGGFSFSPKPYFFFFPLTFALACGTPRYSGSIQNKPRIPK